MTLVTAVRTIVDCTYHRPLEDVAICLQPPQCIRLVLRTIYNFSSCASPSQILQNVLELITCRWGFCHIELELCLLRFVLCLVRASLVFGRMGNGLRLRLLEESENSGRCLIRGLVKEGDDVFRAVLRRAVNKGIQSMISENTTSPKNRLNMIAFRKLMYVMCSLRSSEVRMELGQLRRGEVKSDVGHARL